MTDTLFLTSECASCGVPFGPMYPRAKGRPDRCLDCCQFTASTDERSLAKDQADGYAPAGRDETTDDTPDSSPMRGGFFFRDAR